MSGLAQVKTACLVSASGLGIPWHWLCQCYLVPRVDLGATGVASATQPLDRTGWVVDDCEYCSPHLITASEGSESICRQSPR